MLRAILSPVRTDIQAHAADAELGVGFAHPDQILFALAGVVARLARFGFPERFSREGLGRAGLDECEIPGDCGEHAACD